MDINSKQDLLNELRESFITLYDKYNNGNRNGALIFIEELDGYLRIGIELNFDQSQISFMNSDYSLIDIHSNNINSTNVRFMDGKIRSLKDIEEDSPEYYFLTEMLEKIKKGKSK